jgi:negative regulator of flagellin synthesis FlgM
MNSIDRVSAHNVSRTYVHNAETTAAKAAKAQSHQQQQAPAKGDSISLSDGARSLAAVRHAVDTASDVREQKVNDIKQRISDGTYQVPSRMLARKILAQQSPQ